MNGDERKNSPLPLSLVGRPMTKAKAFINALIPFQINHYHHECKVVERRKPENKEWSYWRKDLFVWCVEEGRVLGGERSSAEKTTVLPFSLRAPF